MIISEEMGRFKIYQQPIKNLHYLVEENDNTQYTEVLPHHIDNLMQCVKVMDRDITVYHNSVWGGIYISSIPKGSLYIDITGYGEIEPDVSAVGSTFMELLLDRGVPIRGIYDGTTYQRSPSQRYHSDTLYIRRGSLGGENSYYLAPSPNHIPTWNLIGPGETYEIIQKKRLHINNICIRSEYSSLEDLLHDLSEYESHCIERLSYFDISIRCH